MSKDNAKPENETNNDLKPEPKLEGYSIESKSQDKTAEVLNTLKGIKGKIVKRVVQLTSAVLKIEKRLGDVETDYTILNKDVTTYKTITDNTVIESAKNTADIENAYGLINKLNERIGNQELDVEVLKDNYFQNVGSLEDKLDAVKKASVAPAMKESYAPLQIDGKQIKYLAQETVEKELETLFEAPDKVYTNFKLVIPGKFQDIAKVEVVCESKKDGRLGAKQYDVLDSALQGDNTIVGIGKYRLHPEAGKIGIVIYAKTNANTKGD